MSDFILSPEKDVVKTSEVSGVKSGDRIYGLDGADIFSMDAPGIVVYGGRGIDTFDGASSSGYLYLGFDETGISQGITFDETKLSVIDPWGYADILLGDQWFLYGTPFSDSIIMSTEGQIYSGDGNDRVTIVSDKKVGIDPGPGADIISGSKIALMYSAGTERFEADLTLGKIKDGHGFIDTVLGRVIDLGIPDTGGNVIGSDFDEQFSVNKGNVVIDGRGGDDLLVLPASYVDFEISRDLNKTTLTRKADGQTIDLSNVERVEFRDAWLSASAHVPEGYLFDGRTDLKFNLSGTYASFTPGATRVGSNTLDAVDMNGDGHPELVFLFKEMLSNYGAVKLDPSPNLLLILSVEDGHLVDASKSVLSTSALQGGEGQASFNVLADLNHDGRLDITWATNNEDGRNNSLSDMTARSFSLLSNVSSGKYTKVELGNENWSQGVAAASATTELPGMVVLGGFQGSTQFITLNETGGKGSDTNTVMQISGGSSFVQHLPWLDDSKLGLRYFLMDASSGDPSATEPEYQLVRFKIGGELSIVATFDQSWKTNPTVINTTSWTNEATQLFVYPRYGYEVAVAGVEGGEGSGSLLWRPSPDQDPLVVLRSGGSVKWEADKGMLDPFADGWTGFSSFEFYRVTNSGISSVGIEITGYNFFPGGNYAEVIDYNRDGYEDIVVYSYNNQAKPDIYLNNQNNGLYLANIYEWLPDAPMGYNTPVAKFVDLNADDIWDLTYRSIHTPFLLEGYKWNGLDPVPGAMDDSIVVHLGERILSNGPLFSDPSLLGAPGYNEQYYLSVNPNVLALVNEGKYESGLDHYLKVGKAQGLNPFGSGAWVHGSNSNDEIVLREGNERAFGNDGDDSIIGKGGDDRIDGGTGYDNVVWSAPVSQFEVSYSSQGLWTIHDIAGNDGSDVLFNVERFDFEDKSVEIKASPGFDFSDLPLELYQFFLVAFGAAPGVTYMQQLSEAYKYGMSVKDIVAAFVGKPQFTDQYPTGLSVRDFSEKLVNNVVKDSASLDTKHAAINQLISAFDSGMSRSDVIYEVFGNLAQMPTDHSEWGGTAKLFDNQLIVAKTYTETMAQSTTDLETLRAAVSAVSKNADVSSAENSITLILEGLFGQSTAIDSARLNDHAAKEQVGWPLDPGAVHHEPHLWFDPSPLW